MLSARRLLTAFLSFLPLTATAALSCQSDSGQSVDWWVAIKAPRGTDYVYADARQPTPAASAYSMNDTTAGALTNTLQQLWTLPATTGSYIVWNDEPLPNTGAYNFSYGHTKGVAAVDTQTNTGFWLSHSIPLFPAGPGLTPTYTGLGSNAWMYGQDAACLSLDTTTVDAISYKYLLAHTLVYDTAVAATAPGNFSALARGDFHNPALCAEASTLQTVGGTEFSVFAKTPAWNADLWSACIAPALSTDLWVESWLRGSEEGPACSGTYTTLDVADVDFTAVGGQSWTEYNDHSKWAVSSGSAAGAICFGDINRMSTQFSRGGGTVCFLDEPELAAAFRAATTGTNSC